MSKRDMVFDIVSEGLANFRSGSKRSYVSHTGKRIKKPTSMHAAAPGRHDQTPARTVLISALCRAWIQGMGTSPTLNHKNAPDSDFFKFAQAVMGAEGIGRIHQHLEEYWSTRKQTAIENSKLNKIWRLSGGTED
jgi:hypothetical protein